MSSLASSSAADCAATTTPPPRTLPLGREQPTWRTHRVRAVVGIALVTGSFIASGPAVAAAAAAGHRPTRPAELRTLRTLRTPQPSEAPTGTKRGRSMTPGRSGADTHPVTNRST